VDEHIDTPLKQSQEFEMSNQGQMVYYFERGIGSWRG